MNIAHLDSNGQIPPRPSTEFDQWKIPLELRQVPQWVTWRPEWDPTADKGKGKWQKPLYIAGTARHAASTRREEWRDFATAVSAALDSDGDFGIGFVVSNEDDFVGIDLDHCVDPETGQIDDLALHAVRRFASYAEYSPSGTGIRIFIKGQKPGPRAKNSEAGIEYYTSARYLTLTGNKLPFAPAEIFERQQELNAFYNYYFTDKDDDAKRPPLPSVLTSDTDIDIINKAMAAKNGDVFSALWRGEWQALYKSQSEADFALLNKLWWWSGNEAQADRLFRASSLYRPKWERKDYRERIFAKICVRPSRHHSIKMPTQHNPSCAMETNIVGSLVGNNDITKETTLPDAPEGIRFLSSDYYWWLNEQKAIELGLNPKKVVAPLYPLDDTPELRAEALEYFPAISGAAAWGTRQGMIKKDNPRIGKSAFVVSNSWVSLANAQVHRKELFMHFWRLIAQHVLAGGKLYEHAIDLQNIDIGEDPTQKEMERLNAKVTRRRGVYVAFAVPDLETVVYYCTEEIGGGKLVSDDLETLKGNLLVTLMSVDKPDLARNGGYSYKRAFTSSRIWNFHSTRNDEWTVVATRTEKYETVSEAEAQVESDKAYAVTMGIQLSFGSEMEVAHIAPGVVTSVYRLEVAETIGAIKNAKNPTAGCYWTLLDFYHHAGYRLTDKAFNDWYMKMMTAIKRKEDGEKQEDAKAPVQKAVNDSPKQGRMLS